MRSIPANDVGRTQTAWTLLSDPLMFPNLEGEDNGNASSCQEKFGDQKRPRRSIRSGDLTWGTGMPPVACPVPRQVELQRLLIGPLANSPQRGEFGEIPGDNLVGHQTQPCVAPIV